MLTDTPFIPSFGNKPAYLIGRQTILDDYKEALNKPSGWPTRTEILVGVRGIGKTAILLELSSIAKKNNYITARVTSDEHLLENIISELQKNGEKVLSRDKSKIKSISAGAFGFSLGLSFDDRVKNDFNFQRKLELLVEIFKKHNYGIAIFIDEIQGTSSVMREFASVYQHLIGDEANISVCMAGLPEALSNVINDKILTFLNRAHKISLEPLELDEVSIFYHNAFLSENISISNENLETITNLSEGYPYLIQLLGYYASSYSKVSKIIDQDVIEKSLQQSKAKLLDNVFRTTLRSLSENDKRFLVAAAQQTENHPKVCDIALKLESTTQKISQYRERLLEKGIIYVPERGRIAFTLPYIKEYIAGDFSFF